MDLDNAHPLQLALEAFDELVAEHKNRLLLELADELDIEDYTPESLLDWVQDNFTLELVYHTEDEDEDEDLDDEDEDLDHDEDE